MKQQIAIISNLWFNMIPTLKYSGFVYFFRYMQKLFQNNFIYETQNDHFGHFRKPIIKFIYLMIVRIVKPSMFAGYANFFQISAKKA